MGENDTDSVVNNKSKVHKLQNVWLGGCGLIRKENACNPTLTAMCYAIRGVEDILGRDVKPPPTIVTT